MEVLLALLVVGGCTAAGLMALKRHHLRRTEEVGAPAPTDDRTLFDLRLGDVLRLEGEDLIVSGVARFTEGSGVRWLEAALDERGARWIIVPEQEAGHVVVGERIEDLGLGDEPSAALIYKGFEYRLERRGQANVQSQKRGAEVDLPLGLCRYWRFRRPGGARVWLYQCGERWMTYAGNRTSRNLVELLPGS